MHLRHIGALWVTACLLTLIAPTPSDAQHSFTWTISASNTDPFENTTPATLGLNTYYLWLVECDLPDSIPAGLASAAFYLQESGGVSVLATIEQNGFLNGGTANDLALAVGGCLCGPVIAAELVTSVEGVGSICFGTSINGSVLGTVDCRTRTEPEIWPIQWTGIGVGQTAPTAGDDCVVPSPGACCFADGSCTDVATVDDCLSLGGVFHGLNTTCASFACPVLEGACCLPDATCDDTRTEEQCDALGGVFSGRETSCATPDICDFSGACCLPDGSCESLEEADCVAQGGSFTSVGQPCTVGLCPGLCCLPDGSCATLTPAECLASGGEFEGEGLCSTPGVCDFSGACCFPNGTCIDGLLLEECILQGGSFRGVGSSCGAVICPTLVGSCCLSDGTCTSEITPESCDALGGVFLGFGTSCDGQSCRSACCLLDGSCVDNRTTSQCNQLGGTIAPFGTNCADQECSVLIGACCLPDKSCSIRTESACLGLGGSYLGGGTDCSGENVCVFEGACCFTDGTCTDDLLEDDCTNAGGTFVGRATVCSGANCTSMLGACCLPGNLCDDSLTESACLAVGGVFAGLHTECASTDCVLSGACCFNDGSCIDDATESECNDLRGSFRGRGTTCDDEECPFLLGACCLPGLCVNATEEPCVEAGGVFWGIATSCDSTEVCEYRGACCVSGDQCVSDVTRAECLNLDGEYLGDFTDCVGQDCASAGACCQPDGSCEIASSRQACEESGGQFAGRGVECDESLCTFGCQSTPSPSAESRGRVPYVWTISASSTNPRVRASSPSSGVRSLFLWLECSDALVVPGMSAAEFDITVCESGSRILGFAPRNGFLNAGTGVSGGDTLSLLLAAAGCPFGPVVTGEILVADFGATYCIAPSPPRGRPITTNCESPPRNLPMGWLGFSSDGAFCSGDNLFCGPLPTSVEPQSWGKIKALYR